MLRLPFRAPNTNAYVERFVQSIKQECLDKFIVCDPGHMDHLVREYVEYYHAERPRQAKGERAAGRGSARAARRSQPPPAQPQGWLSRRGAFSLSFVRSTNTPPEAMQSAVL